MLSYASCAAGMFGMGGWEEMLRERAEAQRELEVALEHGLAERSERMLIMIFAAFFMIVHSVFQKTLSCSTALLNSDFTKALWVSCITKDNVH